MDTADETKDKIEDNAEDKIAGTDSAGPGGFKVLHVRASNFFGGPEKQIAEHLRLLKRTPVRPMVCGFQEKGLETELVRRARVLELPAFSIPSFSAYDPAQILRLRTILRKERPEILCSHDYRSTILSWMARANLPVRQVAFLRGITKENLKVALYYRMERALLRKMDHVVVVSKEQKSFLLSRGLKEDRVSCVPNAVKVETEGVPSKLLSKFRGKSIVATAGRLSPEKGHEYLIKAMPRVVASKPDAVLFIFGDGPLREHLEKLSKSVGCENSIHFLGYVPGFSSLLRDVQLFVLPSLSEGVPNALLEALSAARPVVATKVGGVPEMILTGETGLLVPPGNSDQLAESMIELLSAPGFAGSLGRAGQERVRRSYSFERQLELLIEVYTKTLAA